MIKLSVYIGLLAIMFGYSTVIHYHSGDPTSNLTSIIQREVYSPDYQYIYEPQRAFTNFRIRADGLWTLCRKGFNHIQLGVCSPHFLECSKSGQGQAIRTCPFHGQVFMNGRCLAARNFEECREVLMNTVNEETLQFVEQDVFCSNGAGVYRGENGEMFDACSRQALICHPNRRNSVAIFCPERSSITQLLTCIDAPKYCHDSLELIAPIRQFFLERLCNSKNALIGKFQQFHSNGMGQCTSWHVACLPIPSVLRCGAGEVFDGNIGMCRGWRPRDACPEPGVCRGHEWTSVATGKCKAQFIYCEGRIGRLFTCGDGMVYEASRCQRPEDVKCQPCKEGERRKAERCDRYYKCTSVGNDTSLAWKLKQCKVGQSFNDYAKSCQQDFTCAIKKSCLLGSSFSISCRKYMYCTGERYEMFQCPHQTRWDTSLKSCIYDAHCEFDMTNNKRGHYQGYIKCRNGDIISSSDCDTYKICTEGIYIVANCKINDDYYAIPCSHCPQTSDSYRIDQMIFPGHCAPGDTVAHNEDCAAYFACSDGNWIYMRCLKEGSIYSSATKTCVKGSNISCSTFIQAQCTNGQRIIHHDPAMCNRFVECQHGQWVDMQCPLSYKYDSYTNNCVRGPCSSGPNKYPDILPPPINFESGQSVSLFTKRNGNRIDMTSTPVVHLNYIRHEPYVRCEGDMRIRDQYDCTRFWECENSRRFSIRLCPNGTVYDDQQKGCVKGNKCLLSTCINGSYQPMGVCGQYKICYRGHWLTAVCDKNKVFVNGRCGQEECSKESYDKGLYSSYQCVTGSLRRHISNSRSYFVCYYGQWIERTCSKNITFDWEIIDCSNTSLSHSASHTPKCLSGETRSINGTYSMYEVCHYGQWIQHVCPNMEYFLNGSCVKREYTKGGKCMESNGFGGYRRAQHDCSKYFQCVHGNWTERQCPLGTAFNDRLLVCDHVANVPECS